MPGNFIIWISEMSKVDGSPYCGWKESESVSLCNPMDSSPPGSSIHGILRARILEWVAIPLSRESFQPRNRTQVSCFAGRFFTIWTTRKALLWISLMQSFEGLNETKGGGRSNLLFFPWLITWVETFHIIYSGHQTVIYPICSSVSQVFRITLNNIINSSGSPAVKWQFMGLLQAPKSCEPILHTKLRHLSTQYDILMYIYIVKGFFHQVNIFISSFISLGETIFLLS